MKQHITGFSLAQFVIVVCIIMLLWTIWLGYLKKTDNESNTVAFSMAANQFNEAVHLAHVEWLRQARPDKISLLSVIETESLQQRQFPQTQQNSINMTKNGWPKITQYNSQGCKQLWTDLLNKSTKLITEEQQQNFQRIKGQATCVYKYGNKTLTYFENSGEVSSKLTEENSNYAND
ncbi:hypothetical protein [Catenovulum agarivorans]|uniref:hypothetical protein n=1 Tax=Catenovulum agarivorans TaxID=1172192 RepID=UPI00036A59C8|nr:hypothetical protein [Catenovulum agarivorans]